MKTVTPIMLPVELADLYDNANDLVSKMINEQHKRIDESLEWSVRNKAVPPVKGEITKWKLQWRGIKMITRNEPMLIERWLEQRGKIISPKIRINFTINI